MIELNVILGLAVLSLLGAAAILLRSGAGEQRRATGLRRLNSTLARLESQGGFAPVVSENGWMLPLFDDFLQKAGFVATPRLYLLLALPALVMILIGLALFGFAYGLLGAVGIYTLLLGLFLNWRIEWFASQLVAQLPGFLDSISRILSVGCSLELAFRNASEECQEPLRGIVSQVLLRTQAGLALEDAMTQVAEIYAVHELSYMASVFYLGVRYGGNAQAVLDRIALAMRERQRSQKELRAMTAETRTSAWILSALPVVVGLMTLSANPDYLLGMWQDNTGRRLLLMAAGMQITGMFLLFRMAKIQ